MRAILFGAGGQLGIDLERECRRRGHLVLALRRDQADIAEAAAVRARIASHRPDWVLNAAAYNRVDRAETEPEAAMRVNALAVRTLALACEDAGATLLHYSTDHVFAGRKREPYTEDDPPEPRSAYGVSKLAGELFVRAGCAAHYVLRVAGVYSPAGRYTNRGNFPEFVLRKCMEGAALRIVEDQFATPTFGPALAARSLDILEMRIPPGVYHVGGGQAVSWYDFAVKVARAARCPADIARTTLRKHSAPAPRPRNGALSNVRVEAAGVAPMPSLDACLRDYLALRTRETRRD